MRRNLALIAIAGALLLQAQLLSGAHAAISGGTSACPLPTNPTLTSSCPLPPKPSSAKGADSYAYEDFWWKMRDNYAHFKTRNIDWNCVYKNQIGNARSGKLKTAVVNSLSILKDGHVSFEGDSLVDYGPSDPYRHKTKIKSMYLKDGGAGSSTLVYGVLKKDTKVGYIRVDDMEASPSSIKSAIDKIKGSDAIIVDLRFNDGGDDSTALSLMGHFTKTSMHSHTKDEKTASGFVNKKKINVNPTGVNYTKRVFVLISPITASAGEVGAMAARVLPNATLIGDRTEGILSDIYDFTMRNGWEVEYSKERYYTPQCEVFERFGVPADVDMGYATTTQTIAQRLTAFDKYLQNNLNAGKDPDIEKALSMR